MAAYACLAVSPFVMAASVWSVHPSRQLGAAEISGSSQDMGAPDSSPGAVLLSIEPVTIGLEAESETPVVFPGYLLPADRREEPTHEGS